EYYDSSMTLVAVLEIVLWVRILGSAMLFQKGSWILLAIYTVFARARYSQSSFVQGAISQLAARGDAVVNNQSTPPAARNAWETLKRLARQATDATDPSKYVGGQQQAGPKKAQ
ncbi:Transmembrane nucleoporin, partial [Cryomyces antarcticus]